jgi:hypothetical protein
MNGLEIASNSPFFMMYIFKPDFSQQLTNTVIDLTVFNVYTSNFEPPKDYRQNVRLPLGE